MIGIGQIISGLVSPITSVFTKRNDNKTAIKKANIERIMNSDDKEAELERVMKEGLSGTWKDEYVTVMITMPVPAVFFAVVYSVISGDPLIAQGAQAGVAAIKELIPNYQELLYIVCLAAVGIKALRK